VAGPGRLGGTRQFLVLSDYVNLLGITLSTIKDTETSIGGDWC
jgi:hypothetical protein